MLNSVCDDQMWLLNGSSLLLYFFWFMLVLLRDVDFIDFFVRFKMLMVV